MRVASQSNASLIWSSYLHVLYSFGKVEYQNARPSALYGPAGKKTVRLGKNASLNFRSAAGCSSSGKIVVSAPEAFEGVNSA